jgi:hypothetical protein
MTQNPSKISYLPPTHRIASRLTQLGCALLLICTMLMSLLPIYRMLAVPALSQASLSALLSSAANWLPQTLLFFPRYDLSPSTTHALKYIEDIFIYILFMFIAFTNYILCAYLIRKCWILGDDPWTLRFIWAGAGLIGCVFAITPIMLSHDIFVYAGYGRLISAYHVNPYFTPLSSYPQDPFYLLDDWRTTTSAYGPIWMVVCAIFAFILGPNALWHVIAFRLFALAAHLLNRLLSLKILRWMNYSPQTQTIGTLLYTWNPLVLMESSLGGHNDVFMITFVLLGILFWVRAKQREEHGRRAYFPSLLAFSLAAAVKLLMLSFIVLFVILLICKNIHLLRSQVTSNRQTRAYYRFTNSIVPIVCGAILTCCILQCAFYLPFFLGHCPQEILNSFLSPPSSRFAQNSIMRVIVDWNGNNNSRTNDILSTLIHILSLRRIWDYLDLAVFICIYGIGAKYLLKSPTTATFIFVALLMFEAILLTIPWFYPWYTIFVVSLSTLCLSTPSKRGSRILASYGLTLSFLVLLIYLFSGDAALIHIWIDLLLGLDLPFILFIFTCINAIALPLFAFFFRFIGQSREALSETECYSALHNS